MKKRALHVIVKSPQPTIKGVLYMLTLQEKTLNFNTKIKISNTGGQISSDGGLLLLSEFLDTIDFDKILTENIKIKNSRKYCTHTDKDCLLQILFQIISGYSTDSSANFLQDDPIFTLALGKDKLASQPTISRFLNKLTPDNVKEFHKVAEILSDIHLEHSDKKEMIIDIDSTHCDTFGSQEKTNYNAHYGTNGYHPLIAFDGLSGLFLGAELRPGNTYTGKGAELFLEPIIKKYKHSNPFMSLTVRGDSGFAKPEIYQLCMDNDTNFVIRLKANNKLKTLAEQSILYGDDTDFTTKEIVYNDIDYKAVSWQTSYRVIVKSTREAGALLFRHEYVVTNLENVTPEDVFTTYQKRGVMENYIKEIKSGFFFDKTDSHSFATNEIRMTISCIAYNLIHLMKNLTFPDKEKKSTIATIRFKMLRIAARITNHSRKISVQLTSTNVFDKLFWHVLGRIQSL